MAGAIASTVTSTATGAISRTKGPVTKASPRFPDPQTEKPMKSRIPFAALTLAGFLAAGTITTNAYAAQAAPTADHSSNTGEAVSDAWITAKVKSELATTKGVKSMDVSVKTVDGVVTLTGVLPTHIAVKKAVAAAKSVKGVKDVDASGLKAKD